MPVPRIIVALWALATRLWRGVGKFASSGRPDATGPMSSSSEPAKGSPDGAGTGFEHPPAKEISRGKPDHNVGTSQEQPDSGDAHDENRNTGSGASSPEPLSDSASFKEGSFGSDSPLGDQPAPASTDADLEGPVSTAPRDSEDQNRSAPENGGYSESNELEGNDEGNSSPEKPSSALGRPRKIGGRRGRRQSNPIPDRRSQTPPARPELICQKVPGLATWEIILTVDEQCKLSAVRFNGEPLDHSARRCSVPSFSGELTVVCEDEQRHDIPLFEGDPLIFKLRKNWLGEGRKIARITNGHFIVIAPASWDRTGHAPVEPDDCADATFRAHYFHRQANATGEDLDGFREWSDSPIATGIELTGRRVFDDSDEGDLFVGDAPSFQSSPEIVWARVGEETEHGWGESFLPHAQSLPDVLSDRQGRFFLRVYDSEGRLLDSTAFRYMRKLLQIRVNGADYGQDLAVAPASSGHAPTEVRFVGADGSMIAPILKAKALQAVAPSGALVVPPIPDADRISCMLATEANGVGIVLDLPRLWWRLEDSRAEPGEWQDTPVVMTRKEFQKQAHSNVSVALLSRRFGLVRAGFDDEPAQRYRRRIEDDRIAIPLAHFVDHAQIDRRLNRDVQFNVEWAEEIVPLIVISADPKPEILSFTAEPATIVAGDEALLEWKTRNAGDARVSIDPDTGAANSDDAVTVRPTETTKYTLTLVVSDTEGCSSTVTVSVEQLLVLAQRLTARVMSNRGGWRCGKGFSFRELQDAGVTVQEAMERSIPVDRRRRTLHRINVDKVRIELDG